MIAYRTATPTAHCPCGRLRSRCGHDGPVVMRYHAPVRELVQFVPDHSVSNTDKRPKQLAKVVTGEPCTWTDNGDGTVHVEHGGREWTVPKLNAGRELVLGPECFTRRIALHGEAKRLSRVLLARIRCTTCGEQRQTEVTEWLGRKYGCTHCSRRRIKETMVSMPTDRTRPLWVALGRRGAA